MRDKFKHIFFILCSIVLSVASLFCYSAVANAESVAAERNIDVFIGDSTTDGTGLSGYKYGDYSIVQKLDTWANLFCGKDNAQCANYAHGGAGFLLTLAMTNNMTG